MLNVASFKNVDEDELLKIPGVVYVPLVGKVTVAMLLRNLMRLYEQFHARKHYTSTQSSSGKKNQSTVPVLNLGLQAYSAVVLTAILAMQLLKK